jgi:hypothetical protein
MTSAQSYHLRRYRERRAQGLCVSCGASSTRFARCLSCRRGRNDTAPKEPRVTRPEQTEEILRLYCRDLLPVSQVALRIGRKHTYVYDRVVAADVARVHGVGIRAQCVPWIAQASELYRTCPDRQLGRRFGIDATSLKRTVYRYREAAQPWVVEALERHRRRQSWTDIAQAMQREVADVRCFVSRRAAYVRHKQEMAR